jgi:hypothetical protein
VLYTVDSEFLATSMDEIAKLITAGKIGRALRDVRATAIALRMPGSVEYVRLVESAPDVNVSMDEFRQLLEGGELPARRLLRAVSGAD